MEEQLKMSPSHLFIIGVHRAGSTSLFRYLNACQGIYGSFKKELHYFTSGIYGEKYKYDAREYSLNFPVAEGIFMEASPSYLYGGEKMATYLLSKFPNARFLLILRDPTDRFLSSYFYFNSLTPPRDRLSLESFFERSFEEYSSRKILDTDLNRGLREGVYADNLRGWVEPADDHLKIIDFDHLKEDPSAVVNDVLSFLGVDSISVNSDFSIHNHSRASKNHRLHHYAVKLNHSLEGFFYSHPKLKKAIKAVYSTINEQRLNKTVSQQTREMIDTFYEDPNKRLKVLFEKNGLQIPRWLNS